MMLRLLTVRLWPRRTDVRRVALNGCGSRRVALNGCGSRRVMLNGCGPRSERGAIAGLEGLLFAVLILLGGVIVIVNAWSVVETHASLDAASREFLRTYTSQSDEVSARVEGELAARSSLAGRNTHLRNLEFTVSEPNGFGPCSSVTITISATVPALRAPFIDGWSTMTVRSSATELVDAHREMVTDSNYSPDATECFDE